MRVKVDGGFIQLEQSGKETEFDADEIEHVLNYDVEQNIYGVPEYLGGLQALLLNEAATLFRRRYYSNGAHAGYIFYTNDPNLTEEDEEELRAQITASKGVGNFRSMFVNIPGGSEKAIQIIPVGDFQAKDELEKVKNITRNDVIAAWRMNPALAGIIRRTMGDLATSRRSIAFTQAMRSGRSVSCSTKPMQRCAKTGGSRGSWCR